MAPTQVVRLGLIHGIPQKWNLEENLKTFVEAVQRAAPHSPDILVTPECWLDGYAAADPESTVERLRSVAQQLDDSLFLRRVANVAKEQGLHLCFGFTALENGKIYNAAGLWGADGALIGIYHKTHLQKHDLQYTPGDKLPVWQTPWGPVGIMICADRRWPETARVLRLQGARLILNPTCGFYNSLNEAMMRTRAFENQCFIAFAHPRLSLVTDPAGHIIAQERSDELGVLIVDIDLEKARDDNHLADRRPELYGLLAQPRSAD